MRFKRHVAKLPCGIAISVPCAAVLVLTASADLFIVDKVSTDKALVFSVRTPPIGVYRDTITGGASYRLTRLTHGRGESLPAEHARLIHAYEHMRRPPSKPLLLGLALAATLLFLLYTAYLRVLGGELALLRTQLVLVVLLLMLVISGKLLLVLTPWSALWTPLLALAIPVATQLGRRAAAATSLTAAIAVSLLTPVDFPLLFVLVGQGLTLSATTRANIRPLRIVGGTVAASLASLLAYASFSLLLQQYVRTGPIAQGFNITALLKSDITAAIGGPLVAGTLALFVAPIVQRLLGHVSRTKLSSLADFEHPLLRRVATRAPGTWAHSLNMANMAEMAANAIGANGLLVRVGAYFHDVGKSVQPEYFIENQEDENPHDNLAPEVSADAIVSHVTAGATLARKHKIPEAIVQFTYTHHSNDRVEYFWHKKKNSDPKHASPSEGDFRYPGVPPQNKETGILALCDSVEAAAKTLETRDVEGIRRMVRQIVFGKLLNGTLDASGLTIAELGKITESMIETLHSSMHVRVKYPWQQEGGQNQDDPSAPSGEARPAVRSGPPSASEEDAPTRVASSRNRPGPAPAPPPELPRAADEDGDPAWVSSPELQNTGRQHRKTQSIGTTTTPTGKK